MEAVFRLMDADGSGQLSLGEFRKACDVLNECSAGNEHHRTPPPPPKSPEPSRAVGGGEETEAAGERRHACAAGAKTGKSANNESAGEKRDRVRKRAGGTRASERASERARDRAAERTSGVVRHAPNDAAASPYAERRASPLLSSAGRRGARSSRGRARHVSRPSVGIIMPFSPAAAIPSRGSARMLVGARRAGEPLTDDEVAGLAKAMDADGNGEISFNEFLEAMRHHHMA